MRKRKVQRMKKQASDQGQVEKVWDPRDNTQAELLILEIFLSGQQPFPRSSQKQWA